MLKTFKTEFHPSLKDSEYIRKACGIRRWTWNWAVATYFAEAKNGNFLNSYDLQKMLNRGPAMDPAFSWLTEVNSMARGEALKDFGISLSEYAKARKRSKRTVEKIPVDKYKPSFKKKGKCAESFRLFKKGGTEFKVHSAHDFSVVTTKNRKRMHIHPLESVAFLMSADIKTCTFSIKGGKFFISITYEKTNQRARTCGSGKVGIDLGIKHAAAIYNGSTAEHIDVPASLSRAEKRTERCNQRLARSQKGTKHHNKLLIQLERAYMHEANIKKDWREKLTSRLVSDFSEIVIDDFSFESAKNLDVNRSLYRVGCYAFKARLEIKAQEAKASVVYVPKGTPTTKTCSGCGQQHKLSLSDRTFVCPHCALVLDRDANAAINTYNYCC